MFWRKKKHNPPPAESPPQRPPAIDLTDEDADDSPLEITEPGTFLQRNGGTATVKEIDFQHRPYVAIGVASDGSLSSWTRYGEYIIGSQAGWDLIKRLDHED